MYFTFLCSIPHFSPDQFANNITIRWRNIKPLCVGEREDECLRCCWTQLAHGIRNEKLASEQRSKEHVASSYRQDEGRKGEKEKREKYIDRVWQKTCFIGNKVAKIGRGTRSTGEARSRMNFVERAQSVQATRKPRVWANTAERP